MGKIQLLSAALVMTVTAATLEAGPPVRIGIGIGFGAPYYYRPYYGYGWGYPYYYGYPYPYYVAPPAVVVQPAPAVVPGTVVGTRSASYSPPAATAPEVNQVALANPNAQATFDYHVSRLTNPDEGIRRESVMELGKLKSERAVDPLAATLAGDRSPTVRESAARALGLIASPRSLTALIQAAQADNDREVRHSAQFAVEVIRANLKQR